MAKDNTITTKCTDWSLNKSTDNEAELYWYHHLYHISIWQKDLLVPEPLTKADDTKVWKCFLQLQLSPVNKACCVCHTPEQNIETDLHICCYCGGTVDLTCSITAEFADIKQKKVNLNFIDYLRVCHNCKKTTSRNITPFLKSPNSISAATEFRRALRRAMSIAEEYPKAIKISLIKLAEQNMEQSINPQLLLAELQELITKYFQSDISRSSLEKRINPTKGGGVGIFATQPIPAFTIVGTYPGYLDPFSARDQEHIGRPLTKYALCNINCADYFDQVFIELNGTFTPFINEPGTIEESNVAWIRETHRPESRVSFITIRDIQAGEELLVGYGSNYKRNYPYNYDQYVYHKKEDYNNPPCFALWRYNSADPETAEFISFCGYDREKNIYYHWPSEKATKVASSL